jgi:hypothetical protein
VQKWDRKLYALIGWLCANMIVMAIIGEKLNTFERMEVFGGIFMAVCSGALWGYDRHEEEVGSCIDENPSA